MEMINIGKRIYYLRDTLGFSAKDLAEKVGLDPSQISKIEKGASKPSLDALFRICVALDVSLAEFFAETKVELTPEQRQLLKNSKSLTTEQINLLNKLLSSFNVSVK